MLLGQEGILISNILLVFGVEVVLVEGGRKLTFLTFIGPIIKFKLSTLNSSSPLSSKTAPSTLEPVIKIAAFDAIAVYLNVQMIDFKNT